MYSTGYIRPERSASELVPVNLLVLGTLERRQQGGSVTHVIHIEKVLHGAFKGDRVRITTTEPGRGVFALSPNPAATTPTFDVQARYPVREERAVRALYRTAFEYSALMGERVVLDTNVTVRGAAPARRDRYPVVLHEMGSQRVPCREVVLSGSFAEALDLLGSSLGKGSALAGRNLILEGERVHPAVVQAIEQRLFRLDQQRPGDHQRLHHLIDVLAATPAPEARKDLRRLLDHFLEHLTRQPARPALRRKPDHREEEATDVNHVLPWLVRAVDEEYLLDHCAARLRRLRQEVRGAWKAEVELAIEAGRIDDRLETRAARQRLLKVKPISTATVGLFHGDGPFHLYFSPTGEYLATVGFDRVRVWRTRDWSRVADSDIGQIGHDAHFSANGRHFILFGFGPTSLAWHDWRTRKRLRYLTWPASPDAVSADGRRLGLASRPRGIEVRDAATGRLLRSWPVRADPSNLEFSPDGKWLLWREQQTRSSVRSPPLPPRRVPDSRPARDEPPLWRVVAVEGPAPRIPGLQGKSRLCFSPAGRYLISVSSETSGRITVCVHDADRKFATVSTHSNSTTSDTLEISPDGKRLVLFGASFSPPGSQAPRLSMLVLSLPDLKLISSFSLDTPTLVWPYAIALSPDGKRLAFSGLLRDPTPFLFDTDSGKRILPSPAHGSQVKHLFFSSANKVLSTICAQQFVCRWDAATLRLLSRIQVPGSLRIFGAADAQGNDLLCQDLTSKKDVVLTVVDALTGKSFRSVVLPGTAGEERVSLHRLDDNRVVVLAASQLFEVDHRAGKLLGQRKYDRTKFDSTFELSVQESLLDRGTLFAVGARGMGSSVTLARLEIRTGKVDPREGRTEAAWTTGFVPGQRLLWAAESEQMRFLDRETLKTTSVRRLRATRPEHVTFIPDGSRYAFYEERWERSRDFLQEWKQPSSSLIRIHDRKTGRTLGAIACPSRPDWLRFRPDGRALAVVCEDTLALWDLSELEGR
jgi:WD40 repeat protein